MESRNLTRATEYYTCVGNKNIEGARKYLHDEVEFSSPLATLKGKKAVATATSNFMNTFKSLTIKAKFSSEDQAMIVYDVDVPGVSKEFPGASLLTFKNDLIVKIELFFDASKFR